MHQVVDADIRPAKSCMDASRGAANSSLSRKDFRWRLFESLQGSKVEDRLKVQFVDHSSFLRFTPIFIFIQTQLRSHIIGELRRYTSPAALVDLDHTLPVRGLLEKVVDSLFVDYLKATGNEFTLSVFLPESGINQPGQVRSSCFLFNVH